MGRVAALWRHPIKGHGREPLDRVTLATGQTMPWDRRWAVAHEAARTDGTAWAPSAEFSRGSKVAALMAINARSDEAAGTITLSHPDRPDLTFDPDSDTQAFLGWVKPLMPANRAQSARFVRVEGRGMTDTDFPSISLINLATNAAMSDAVGRPVSALRWRANIHVEDVPEWEEFNWVGKAIRVGQTEMTVREPILRCLATAADPETGIRDIDTLGTLNKTWGHQDFGIYAEVTAGGEIAVGDAIEVL